MGRAQFEYDEVGNTFYYVIVSFYAVILFPLTHFLWPSVPKKLIKLKSGCQCEGDVAKRARLDAVKPWEFRKRIAKALTLAILWAFFLFIAYKVTQIEHTFEEYDPYKILNLDRGADVTEVKKRYRELMKTHHPDRGGDAGVFDNIVKAHNALTDDESRENWEKYGNPDGPKATTFGIALPKWIVSEKYGMWVLAFYGLLFMIILPVGVGLWWYNSMKYSADKVLIETTRVFYHFLQKTPNMEVNRTLMVLSGSFEFWRKFNAEIVEHENDDIELPRLMKELRNIGENKKEAPFHHPYSVKARILLHAYLSRVDVGSDRLEKDQMYMLGRVVPLLDEFLRMLLQMIIQLPIQRPPTLETLENLLRLYPMFIQAQWNRNSPLLQLPHLTEQNIPFLRKNRVITCSDLANLSETKRRSLINMVTDEEYEDIITVLSMMPRLDIETTIEVQGEDDKGTVTVGSLVTLRVKLRRSPLLDRERREVEIAEGPKEEDKDDKDGFLTVEMPKKKVWEKSKPKKKGNKGKASKKNAKKKVEPVLAEAKQTAKVEETVKAEGNKAVASDDVDNRTNSGSESESCSDESEFNKSEYDDDIGSSSSDDEFLDEGGPITKKETLLDTEPTNHHEVHCPQFPTQKYEWWFLYLTDRKSKRLASMIVPCKTLDLEKAVDLRFSAPSQKGTCVYTLNVRSDSYMDCDYSQEVKVEVHPAREPVQVQYDDTDEGEQHVDFSDSSDEYTEASSDDD